MAQLSLYVVTVNDVPHTVQLSAEDAERYGDAAVPAPVAPAPVNKAAAAATK